MEIGRFCVVVATKISISTRPSKCQPSKLPHRFLYAHRAFLQYSLLTNLLLTKTSSVAACSVLRVRINLEALLARETNTTPAFDLYSSKTVVSYPLLFPLLLSRLSCVILSQSLSKMSPTRFRYYYLHYYLQCFHY